MGTCTDVLRIVLCSLLGSQIVRSQGSASTTPASRAVVNVTVVKSEPYVMVSKDGTFFGFLPDLFSQLEGSLPYKFSLYLAPDGKHGHIDNGSWTGMMGEVIKGAADIALPLTVTRKRNEYVDFTVPLQTADSAIVLRRPPARSPSIAENLVKLLTPLEFPVWLMTALAFFVTSTVLYIISHTNPYDWRRMAKDKEATLREAESFTCLNSFWFVISTLAWQGYVRAPRSMGGRITVTAWWMFTLIFILSYTASLTNFLRAGQTPAAVEGYSTIQSFEDLGKAESVHVGMVSGGSTAMGFKQSVMAVDQRIYDKFAEFEKSNQQKFLSYDDGVKYLRSKSFLDFAMIMEVPSAKFVVHQKPCDLYMISEHRSTRFLSMAVAKKSPLLVELNTALMKYYESGRMTQLEKKWFESQCDAAVLDTRSDVYKVPPFYKLDLGTFSGALLILLVGLVLGGLVSALEVCIYKWAESHSDEDEPAALGQNDMTSTELLPSDSKKAGATSV